MSLSKKSCVACKENSPRLTRTEIARLMPQVPGWVLGEGGKTIIYKKKFRNYKQAWEFVNKVSEIAEAENHHPDIAFGWGYATLNLTTHAINGLHENDFIVAAKVSGL